MSGLFGQREVEHTGPYIRVAVERSIDAEGTARGLTYRAGTLDVCVGQRVEVPLGRGNRSAAGIVVVVGGEELLDGIPPSKVKSILKVSPARLPERLVELARWISEYYVCPLGMTLATMMPAAVKQSIGVRRQIEVQPVESDAARTIIAAGVTPKVEEAWNAVQDLGMLGAVSPDVLKTQIGAKNLGPINKLVAVGLLRRVEREIVTARTPLWDRFRVESPRGPVELTPDQARISKGIAATLGAFGVHLIRGVTGSGKTEVYLRIIEQVIARGQTALMLVPEISLTPQTAGRFLDRFAAASPGTVAVLHSGLTAAERHRQWALAASEHAKVVVGARSAVFAPLRNVGVIVVDEEHATDYKQDQLPRYNGRDVAIKRGQLDGCPVVLGSATPSLESWANATTGKYRLWELTQRVGDGSMPRVEIVDLAEERRNLARQAKDPEGPRRFFQAIGIKLADALSQTLQNDGQAILLLNRRGYSSYICCPDAECGWVMKCDHCDASMVVHKLGPSDGMRGSIVRCHHCLSEQMLPRKCPVCSRAVMTLGVGTQKLEEELGRTFSKWLKPGKSLVRVDGDTMKSAADYFDVLARFARGEVKVLLGTQMIAKGLDYPNVRLVGVINADTGLTLPDFRSSERTFQLVSQVAGRAGRGGHGGLVIVQTVNPGEPAIVAAAAHDYRGFAASELRLRHESGLPPATRMARIVVRDEDFSVAQKEAVKLADLLKGARTRGVVVLGPGPAPISRVAGFFRFSIELIAPTAQELHAALAKVRASGLLKSDARTAVDVDPVALV
jgi:primosomal protein N' (replication factor Y) (superfamily II helicase)